MTRKKKTTLADPGDWAKNLADFDYDEAAYATALQAHLDDPNGDYSIDGSGDS